MIKIIEGNLFDSNAQIIAHQVNCQKKMGSGVAKQVKERYPHVFNAYEDFLKDCSKPPLGAVQIVPIDINQYDTQTNTVKNYMPNAQYICNMFAQADYGYDGRMYTDLYAFQCCLWELKMWACGERKLLPGGVIAMPWMIGCVRGGANWDKDIYPMIQKILGNKCNIELWKL